MTTPHLVLNFPNICAIHSLVPYLQGNKSFPDINGTAPPSSATPEQIAAIKTTGTLLATAFGGVPIGATVRRGRNDDDDDDDDSSIGLLRTRPVTKEDIDTAAYSDLPFYAVATVLYVSCFHIGRKSFLPIEDIAPAFRLNDELARTTRMPLIHEVASKLSTAVTPFLVAPYNDLNIHNVHVQVPPSHRVFVWVLGRSALPPGQAESLTSGEAPPYSLTDPIHHHLTTANFQALQQQQPANQMENSLQKNHFSSILCSNNRTFGTSTDKTIVVDTSKTPSLLDSWSETTLKPDFMIVRKRKSKPARPHESDILGIIELKRPTTGTGKFVEGRIQLYRYLECVLNKSSSSRPFVYGVHTNGDWLVGVRVESTNFLRNSSSKSASYCYKVFVEKEHATNDEIKACINFLLNSSHVTLGLGVEQTLLKLKNGCQVPLRLPISHGQFSFAYEISVEAFDLNNTDDKVPEELEPHLPFVVKFYASAATADHERTIYSKLESVSNTTKLLPSNCQPLDSHYVCITPLCRQFKLAKPGPGQVASNVSAPEITYEQIKQLKSALTEIHKLGIVHGDIVSSNIFYKDGNTALLNDWSHAHELHESTADEAQGNDLAKLDTAIDGLSGLGVAEWRRAKAHHSREARGGWFETLRKMISWK